MSRFLRNLPQIAFVFSAVFLLLSGGFLYGVSAHARGLFPYPQIRSLGDTIREIVSPGDQILETKDLRYSDPVETRLPGTVQPGLVLVFGEHQDRQASVKVIDRAGRVIQEWQPVWLDIWPPDEGTFPEGRRPLKGMILHGLDILPDGDIVANFEHLSTFRMDVCGDIVWKLDNLGHHSVSLADDGMLWVSSEDYIAEGPTGYPNHVAPLRSWKLQNIDPKDGRVLREIPVIDIFLRNDLAGLLYLSSLANGTPSVTGDTLHLNDVEALPRAMQSDLFEPGDLLISLRNISTVMVVDPDTLKVKFISSGHFMRQHDADFLPGDRISVFDNRNFTAAPGAGPAASRIVELDAKTGAASVALDGSGAAPGSEPFYTEIMGTHQRLANGNILVVPSGEGRVLEFTPDGSLAWRYDNRQGEGINRRVYGAYVLPEAMDEAFFKERQAACTTRTSG